MFDQQILTMHLKHLIQRTWMFYCTITFHSRFSDVFEHPYAFRIRHLHYQLIHLLLGHFAISIKRTLVSTSLSTHLFIVHIIWYNQHFGKVMKFSNFWHRRKITPDPKPKSSRSPEKNKTK